MLRTLSEKLDSLIIIDRRVDMISPLLTQLTYEVLIDELIGIKNCECSLPCRVVDVPLSFSVQRTSSFLSRYSIPPPHPIRPAAPVPLLQGPRGARQ